MSADLFNFDKVSLNQLPIKDGELYFLDKLPLKLSNADILSQLIETTPWRTESINIWGKTHIQPRLIAWFGDEGKSYNYSGKNFHPLDWTPLLNYIKMQVEIHCNHTFNSVLLNYYRNGADSLGFHSDDEVELGKTPIIASLSLGGTRTFTFKHKFKKEVKPLKINLRDGNLLLMKGDTQINWLHGILKDSKHCEPRINLTFRQIIDKNT